MKLVYMGTPDFAVPTLETLIQSKHEVVAVVTQPDKPKGRGKEVQFTPVKEVALKHNIPVYQPVKVRDSEFISFLKELNPDAIIVAAFGQILPKEIIDMPPYGCINVHASLLPKYRGAAPIQWCVIDGEKETGITAMHMDVGLDTGDMLKKVIIPIDEKYDGDIYTDLKKCAEGIDNFKVSGKGNNDKSKKINEDGEAAGATSADASGQYVQPLFGKPIKRRTVYLTQEQVDYIKKKMNEEAVMDTAFGNFGFDAPIGDGKKNKGNKFFKDANDHDSIIAKSWPKQ